jgi:hypothetical protein
MGYSKGTANLLLRRFNGTERRALRAMKIEGPKMFNQTLTIYSEIPTRQLPRGPLPILPEMRRRIRTAREAMFYADVCLCCSSRGKTREWLAYAAANLFLMTELNIFFFNPKPVNTLVIHENLPLEEQIELFRHLSMRTETDPDNVQKDFSVNTETFTTARELISLIDRHFPGELKS